MSVSSPSERTIAAVDAAAEAGRRLGLDVTEPTVLYDAFSVVVHLKPSPVVARVPTVMLPSLRGVDHRVAKHRRELDVVGRLADAGHPVVAPSPLVPREPVVVGDVTFGLWEWVEQDHAAEPDWVANTASTATLHAILRDHDGPLPYFAPADGLEASLRSLSPIPGVVDAADIDRAWSDWRLLEPLTVSPEGLLRAFPNARVQPIHGDSPAFNMLTTTTGPLYADFEEVTLGPVEWDLTLGGDESIAAYDAAAAEHGAPPVDRRLLSAMESLRMLQVVACLVLLDDMPALADGVKGVLDMWRARPVEEF